MIHIYGPQSNSKLTEVQEMDIQPNAIDLRLDKLFKFTSPGPFTLSADDAKHHRAIEEVEPQSGGWFSLPAGTYQIVMQNTVSIGPDEAGWVITRSSLNRNGIFITSGLYDSGYNGVMAGALHATCPFVIQRGARVGQFLLFKAESLKQYDGSYGFGKSHDQIYGVANEYGNQSTDRGVA